MARLVHLNGPPGVGKSTLALRLAAEDPMALSLDVDVVVSMLGGWRNDFWGALPVARRLAAAMAREHLAGGHDVFLPQLVTSEEELAPYSAAVGETGATYVEVVLLADPDATVGRFSERAADGDDPVGRHLGQLVAAHGGTPFLDKIRDDLLHYLDGRRAHATLDTTHLSPTDVHRRLRALLAAIGPEPQSGVLRRGAVGPDG